MDTQAASPSNFLNFKLPTVDDSNQFLSSTSFLAKLAFFVLIIILFVFLLNIGIYVVSWTKSNAGETRLLNGMVEASTPLNFYQDPTIKDSINISRSYNEAAGVEFTWSVWLYIDKSTFTVSNPDYRHVFNKGSITPYSASDANKRVGIMTPNNGPGLYIKNTANKITLNVIMNTYIPNSTSTSINDIDENIEISDIPLNTWFNVMIMCQDKNIDIFMNGMVARSIELITVPKQNYGDVNVAMNHGFTGFISNLWYYDYVLSSSEIQNIAMAGPSLKTSDEAAYYKTNAGANLFSDKWYFDPLKLST
jgi:hypothetical protein